MLGRKGQQMGVIGFILFAVTVIIGVIVYSSIDSSLGATLTGAAAAAKGNVTTNTYSAFQLVAVGPIIFGAVIILGIVGLLMAARR